MQQTHAKEGHDDRLIRCVVDQLGRVTSKDVNADDTIRLQLAADLAEEGHDNQ